MLRLLPVLLAAAAAAQEPLLHEERSWTGVAEVVSVSHAPAPGRGRETQREKIEFRLVTEPPKVTVGRARLPLGMREAKGAWGIEHDMTEGSGAEAVVRKGGGEGRLWPTVEGWVEPERARYRLVVHVAPQTLVAKATLSGMWQGRFTTWRTALDRRPFLAELDVEGETAEDGRVLAGERTFVDRREAYPRDVTIRWRIERVDPVLRGRVLDHLGRPAAGLRIVARTTNPDRRRRRLPPLFKEGTTDAEGRFALEAFWAPWTVEVAGAVRDGVVHEGRRVDLDLRPDHVPPLDLEARAYRLDALPRPELLVRHFQGDVTAYFEYTRARVPERRLEAALVPPGE
jgi:hypothetical protein